MLQRQEGIKIGHLNLQFGIWDQQVKVFYQVQTWKFQSLAATNGASRYQSFGSLDQMTSKEYRFGLISFCFVLMEYNGLLGDSLQNIRKWNQYSIPFHTHKILIHLYNSIAILLLVVLVLVPIKK